MAQLTLNLAEGSVSFDFGVTEARQLQTALLELMDRLKRAAAKPPATVAAHGQPAQPSANKSASKPTPMASLDYKHRGELFLAVFCNPNIWPSPFAAKVLLTLKSDRIRLSTEAELSRLLEDVGQYIEQQS